MKYYGRWSNKYGFNKYPYEDEDLERLQKTLFSVIAWNTPEGEKAYWSITDETGYELTSGIKEGERQ